MKWVELLLFGIVAASLAGLFRADRRMALLVAFAIGFLPFVTGPWHLIVSPYEMKFWPGYVKGWQVSLLDAVAVGYLLGSRRNRGQLPFRWAFLAFIAATLLAVAFAPNVKYAVAYPIQLARAFLIFAAVARLTTSPQNLQFVLRGLFAGLSLQAAISLELWLRGAVQSGGSFGHQNLLGFVSHMALIPAFGLLLSGLSTRWAIVGLVSGTIAVILTASRATIVFAAVGLALTYILAALSAWSGRKAAIGVASFVALALAYPLAHIAFERRFAARGDETFFAEDEERAAFQRAAEAMITEHPWGVGPNHYVVVANTEGYNDEGGVVGRQASRSTSVHNSYLLIWAEAGFLGFASMVCLLFTVIFVSVREAFRRPRRPDSDVLVGIAGGMCAVCLHSFYEWMFVTYQSQYIFAISLGMAAGIIRARRIARARVSRAPFGSAAGHPVGREVNVDNQPTAAGYS